MPTGKLPDEKEREAAQVPTVSPPTLPPWDESAKQIGALNVMKNVVKYVPRLD